MPSRAFREIVNAKAFRLCDVPNLNFAEFRDTVVSLVAADARLAALQIWNFPSGRRMVALLADNAMQYLLITSAAVDDSYYALTPDCPSAQWFEREIYEEYGITPVGHPWLKPLRRFLPGKAPGDIEYFSVDGANLHQVGVGPVHAGVIEPGHFRFTCDGEKVLNLEISLGYQHRGLLRKFLAVNDFARLKLMETLAGDSTIAHTLAYARAMEALAKISVPAESEIWRVVALELERLANHIGDLGALSGDAGFLPTASYCGRLRGDILNTTALLCGNRFGRNFLAPGGLAVRIAPTTVPMVRERIEKSLRECTGAVELMLDTPSVLARFDDIGRLSTAQARELGIVGVAARASGLDFDIRNDFPVNEFYGHGSFHLAGETSGDVGARARVRWAECRCSFALLRQWLDGLAPNNEIGNAEVPALSGEAGVVSLEEGWRGEVCHSVWTDSAGRIQGYQVVDPSFHNWAGLAMALRNEEISNFPLCNKSFNLSYCGTDL